MDAESIREFVRRDRQAPADAKQRFWADSTRMSDPLAPWHASQALFHHVRAIQPDYPRHADREQDYRDHVDLKHRIDRAAHAFARR